MDISEITNKEKAILTKSESTSMNTTIDAEEIFAYITEETILQWEVQFKLKSIEIFIKRKI